MFRNLNDQQHLSGGKCSASTTRHLVASSGINSQESSWIGLLSGLRPALAFLQRYLPGRARTTAQCDTDVRWFNGDFKTSLFDGESDYLQPHIVPLTQPPGPAGLPPPRVGGTLPWLSADSLREIQEKEETDMNHQIHIGYFSSLRTVFSYDILSSVSSQEIKPTGGTDWLGPTMKFSAVKPTRWGGFLGDDQSNLKGSLSYRSWAEVRTVSAHPCPQPPAVQTIAIDTKTSNVFVSSSSGEVTLGENTGLPPHKEQPANNGGLHMVQNTEGSTPDLQLNISSHLSSSRGAACNDVTLLTLDLDNGYSSLEEEQLINQLTLVKTPTEEQMQQEAELTETCVTVMVNTEEVFEEGDFASEKVDVTETSVQPADGTALASLHCQNKAIAFIMGCPCSDDDSSIQSDEESSYEDDDDGFDSEGSSDFSDSSDEDDEVDESSDSESEVDSENERLWSILCESGDPYDPRNFTARQFTGRTPVRSIPATSPPSSTQSTPLSSPDLPSPLLSGFASPAALSSSPPSGSDTWDDSASASEVDEAESLRQLSLFSSSDPYSLLNFQALVRTQQPVESKHQSRPRPKKAAPRSPCHNPASPPRYRKDEAEERLESGFGEPFTSCSQSSNSSKKVRFCDEVEEFFASCGEEEEDRRGPWEEFARDRCRFLRRCKEVELSISYCLLPEHRSLMFHRLRPLAVHDV